ncbi:protein timeless homolog [Eurosta solidaginis]|uniref:protein timeless homolog n=1 Tax=Eurosta solidaginis TaxID=178769 RepID=UPI00353172FF
MKADGGEADTLEGYTSSTSSIGISGSNLQYTEEELMLEDAANVTLKEGAIVRDVGAGPPDKPAPHLDDGDDDVFTNKLLRPTSTRHLCIGKRSSGKISWATSAVSQLSLCSARPTEIDKDVNAQNAQFLAGEEHEDDDDDDENEEYPEERLTEKPFKFEDFAKRLLNPKIVRACTVILTDWDQIPTKSLKATVTILHRIAVGCSCPAMLYQAKLFRIFQRVFNVGRDVHHEELRRLGIYVIRKFVEVAPTNPKIYAELLFWKSVKEANELEGGYCDAYEPAKGVWTEEQEDQLRMLVEENQRNPESDKDVIDWILEHLGDKTRTRRMVLKKLKELGLSFKAPTKRSTAKAVNKNLWRTEDDEELQSLYDEHRLAEDCLQRIVNEFADRRTQRQIIKRLIQLHIIADKSEIMPKKQRKRKSKKKPENTQESEVEDEDEFMEEPQFGEMPSTSKAALEQLKKQEQLKNKKKKKNKIAAPPKPMKPVKRKIVRTPLDADNVSGLIAQLIEKYQGAIDWLKEALEDAAEETEEPNEEDDGVPLLPLQEIEREAVEDKDFQQLLVALGIQKPLVGTENYWRIPVHLNASDLKIRAKILAGEDIKTDMKELEEDDANEEAEIEAENDAAINNESNDESDESESETDSEASAAAKEASESEEDFFDNFAEQHKKKMASMENFMEKRVQKMRSIMFNKSDEEDNERAGIGQKKEKKKRQAKPRAQKAKQTLDESSADEAAEIERIKTTLDKKRRQNALSSDDEEEENEKISKNTKSKAAPQTDASRDLFDQLKSQANKKQQEKRTTYTEELEELNFNSEDYRKRLLELGDSEDDEEVVGGVNENMSNAGKNKIRMRRANIIDSDSEEEVGNEMNNENDKMIGVDKKAKDINDEQEEDNNSVNNNADLGDGEEVATTISAPDATIGIDVATTGNDKTNNQANVDDNTSNVGVDEKIATQMTTAQKRKRGFLNDSDDEVNENNNTIKADDKNEEEEDEDAFIVRRKPTKEEQKRLNSEEEPAKRRRLAIIDDDDDEY